MDPSRETRTQMLMPVRLGTGAVMYRYTIGRMLENSMRLSPEIDKWWEVTLGFTLCLNVLVPGLIIGRVWYVQARVFLVGLTDSNAH